MERAVCRWPDAQPRAGFGSNGTKNFQNREKGRLPKLRSKSSLPWSSPDAQGAECRDWSHLKMAETAAGQNTHRKTSPPPLSSGILRGKLELSPA